MKNIFLSTIMFACALVANAKLVECIDLEESGYKITANFDSTAPSLESSVITYNLDGSVRQERKYTYLTSEVTCETNVKFLTDCVSQEQENSLGYSFKFKCPSKKLSGSFYLDENGTGHFHCSNTAQSARFLNCVVK